MEFLRKDSQESKVGSMRVMKYCGKEEGEVEKLGCVNYGTSVEIDVRQPGSGKEVNLIRTAL